MKRQDGYLTRKSGSWLGHYSKWILDHGSGQRKRVQRAFKIGPASMTKTEAREKLRARIVEETGITADSRVTVAWFVEQRWKPLHEGGWRESTKQTNGELLKIITDRFGATPIEDVDSVLLHGWINSLAKSRSGSAVKHLRIFVRSIMQEALDQNYIRANPAKMLRVPKLKAVRRAFLTIEEVTALLKAAKWQQRERALLRLILVTGLRPSELFALRWKSIDLKKGVLTISETIYRGKVREFTKTTETGEVQRLMIPAQALDALSEWHGQSDRTAKDDYIFPNSEGGFISKENYQQRVLKPLASAAKIPQLNFQVLRRTVATHAQDLGSLKDVSTLLRHRQLETTQQFYIQAIEETVKQTGARLANKLLG